MKIVTFKLDETLLDLIDAYALSKGMTRSQVIRHALVRFFSKMQNENSTTCKNS